MILIFNKPYEVLSQFTKEIPIHKTLVDFGFPKDVYPIGRLDANSEGLLLLSNDKKWTERLLKPYHGHKRTYHVQVEGVPAGQTLAKLEKGVLIRRLKTAPCQARLMKDPHYPERHPPIRFRLTVPTSWIEMRLIEGKNRQVRRMTAAVGHPTLRLIRVAIGQLHLGKLPPGQWRELEQREIDLLLKN
ncbi:MAG TPA: pseudouridine synthase [Candidatus Omnitrophota bacterium]|jgi:23S rRNA pseudouridine2457 synthase|nr:MAG: Ribosomal large subunit pseudouridine synthase E [Candidatus Omnitrophica bacterium ADurb.Bin314]HQB94831.1 pseudouridine synthase [Candidatus Omnitrophota bacterium]